MLSKIWFWPLALACSCRLGTPRPDGAEGPAGGAAKPSGASSTPAPASDGAPSAAPAILTLPGSEEQALPPRAEEPVGRPHRVVVLGDSLSDARVGGGGYLRAFSRACANAKVENLAKGGWMVN